MTPPHRGHIASIVINPHPGQMRTLEDVERSLFGHPVPGGSVARNESDAIEEGQLAFQWPGVSVDDAFFRGSGAVTAGVVGL